MWGMLTLGALALAVLGFSALYWILLAPSGDLNRYHDNHYHGDDTAPTGGAVKITFLGTTTLLLDDGETQLLTDGFFTRPSVWRVLLWKVATKPAVVDPILDHLKLDRLRAVFVAHSHYDHALDSAHVVKWTGKKPHPATLYGSLSTLNIGRGAGLREDQMAEYGPGKALSIGKFRVTVLNATHSPMRPCLSDLGKHITAPLRQPARATKYREGGSYDLLIRHGAHTLFIKPGANFAAGAIADVRADVVFLGTGALGKQDRVFQEAYYAHTVGALRPTCVIPIHWDDFFRPLSKPLRAPMKVADNLRCGFDFLIEKTSDDSIKFCILQGYQSVMLLPDGAGRSVAVDASSDCDLPVVC